MTEGAEKLSVTVGYPGVISGEGVPKRLSPDAIPLCRAEWSWSPTNSREDDYALHSGRKDWFLWVSFYNDCDGKIDWSIIGRMPKAGVDAESAARTLLMAFWRFDQRETDLERPHYCSSGWLSYKTLSAIMDTVWLQEGAQSIRT